MNPETEKRIHIDSLTDVQIQRFGDTPLPQTVYADVRNKYKERMKQMLCEHMIVLRGMRNTLQTVTPHISSIAYKASALIEHAAYTKTNLLRILLSYESIFHFCSIKNIIMLPFPSAKIQKNPFLHNGVKDSCLPELSYQTKMNRSMTSATAPSLWSAVQI